MFCDLSCIIDLKEELISSSQFIDDEHKITSSSIYTIFPISMFEF